MKVAIDPGHGMSNANPGTYDPGAVSTMNGTEYREAVIALEYGLRLRDILAERQVDVYMTREDHASDAPVGSRAPGAKAAGCQMLVSLHLNAAESKQANGAEVLYRDAADKPLAERMQKALVEATGFRNRGVIERTNLAVLKFDGQAILLELGFISNDAELTKMLDPALREKVCQAMADVVAPAIA